MTTTPPSKTKYWAPLIALTLFFAGTRFGVPVVPLDLSVTGLFKDVAHLYVGGLFGAWLATGERGYLYLAIGITAVELIAFFTR